MNSKIIFGKMVSYFRRNKNLTMEEFGLRLGKSKSAVSRWESGERYPKIEEVEVIADFFGTDVETLLFGFQPNDDMDILVIYNQLEHSRQEKVYDYTNEQLNMQNNVVNLKDKIQESTKSIINGRKSAAGHAIEVDDYDAEVVSESIVPHGADELVEITGDSMEPLITKGSDVYIRHQPSVENGEVAIIRIENEGVTCKRFYLDQEKKTITLKSENSKYEDMHFGPSQVTVLGKVLL